MFQRNWARLTSRSLILFLSCALTGGITAQVRARITQPIDERSLVRLTGSVHPLVAGAADLGRVAADLPMERAMLQLSASAEQEAALEQLLAAQQDPGAAEYHQWLTPEQFGERFGVSAQDLDAVTAWLAGQGLRVTAVAPSRRTIEFGGSARQVEQAFHTEIHEFRVAGERHVANATELSIPQALAPVVGGVVSLHNFRRQPLHRVIGTGARGSGGGLRSGDGPDGRRACPVALRFRDDLRRGPALEQRLRRHRPDHRNRRPHGSEAVGRGFVPRPSSGCPPRRRR